MKMIIAGLLLISLHSFAQTDVLGIWKLASYIYDGQSIPLPNPDLDLRFTFFENGISHLRWFRLDEPGSCERTALYDVADGILHQKNIWVNPDNDHSCAADSEMRPDAESYTGYRVVDGQLFLDLALDDKPFIYVFSVWTDERSF